MISRVFKLSCASLAIALAFSLVAHGRDDADTTSLVGKPAPELTLQVAGGKPVKLADQKGSVVMIDFWATWCPPCRASLPHVNKISQDKDLAAKGLKVWAANAHEAPATAAKFVKENNYSFTVPTASAADMKKYLISGIPTTVIVGRDGTIKNAFVGYGEGSDKLIEDAIDAALKETGQTS